MIAIIVSKKDSAGMNIKSKLLEENFVESEDSFDSSPICFMSEHEEVKLYTLDEDTVYSEDLDLKIDADLFIFATRHQSEAGKPALCVHTPGNWGKAEFGGQDGKVCVNPASVIRQSFLILHELAGDLGHQITVEQTHHGPYMKKPCMFIEIGSSEKHWNDPELGSVIAKAILRLVLEKNETFETVMVLGGGHYNQVANKILLRSEFAVGHICAKYSLGELNFDKLRDAIGRHSDPVSMVVLDWKGMGEYKEYIVELLDKVGIPYEKAQVLLKQK